MKIKNVKIDSENNEIVIDTDSGRFAYPILKILPENQKITGIIVDEELGGEAVTLFFDNGTEETLHVDDFLEAAGDPDYFRNLTLYKFCILINGLVDGSGLTQREIAEKMKTSVPQISRLLSTTNYSKTIDQLVRLAAAIGFGTEMGVKPIKKIKLVDGPAKFKYLDLSVETANQLRPFKSLGSGKL